MGHVTATRQMSYELCDGVSYSHLSPVGGTEMGGQAANEGLLSAGWSLSLGSQQMKGRYK